MVDKQEWEEVKLLINNGVRKIKSYKKTLKAFKIIGFISIFIALFLKQWILAFLLWLFFFPDIEEIIRGAKRLFNYIRLYNTIRNFRNYRN